MKEFRFEPQTMTILDSILLVFGVAIAIVLIHPPDNGPVIAPFNPRQIFLFRSIALALGVTLSISFVGLARTVTYRRMPYPAEWLAILLTFVILALQNFSLYDAVDVVLAKVPGLNDLGLTIVGLQWLMGLFFSIAVVLALILLGVAKKRIPDWGKTVLLTGVAVIASVGPLWAIMTHGADLISPSEGFGPGSTGILYHEACMDLASVPLGLLFGIPAVAAMTQRLRGFRWNWTEWVGFNASIIVILGLGMLHRAEFPELSWGWLVERLILLVWYLIVALLGRLFLVYVNPIWERAIGLSKDQDRSADAASSSLSSIP